MESPEEKEFLAAFEKHSDALFRHALFRVSDRERAYDLTQDAFMKCWDYVRKGGTINQYKSFLYRTLHNLIIDAYRKKHEQSLDAMLEDEASASAATVRLSQGSLREAEESLDAKFAAGRVVASIPELPEHYREVLTMRFIDELSIQEIAQAIGVSENVVSVRIHRGIGKLKTLCDV